MNVREWALPVYSILLQLATGALLVLWIIRSASSSKFNAKDIDEIIRNPLLVIAFTTGAAMIGAHFHLSRPFYSFLAVLNFRSSWLSREIVFTVLFFLAVSGLWFLSQTQRAHRKLISGLGWLAIGWGFTAIYCMAHIYLLPTQVAWNMPTTIISFYDTMLFLGVMAVACLMVLDLKFAEMQPSSDLQIRSRVIHDSIHWLALIAGIAAVLDIAIIFFQIFILQHGDITARTSVSLLFDIYMPLFIMRLLFLIAAPVWLMYAVYHMKKDKSAPQQLMTQVYITCLLALVAEIIGRFLFYATHIRIGL